MSDLKAGRELDALVAERVMGWKKLISGDWGVGTRVRTWETTSFGSGFQPSTDIAAAWEVVEKLQDRFYFTVLDSGQVIGWYCSLVDKLRVDMRLMSEARASTVPLAICLAALKACE